jgi:hypothetical protein
MKCVGTETLVLCISVLATGVSHAQQPAGGFGNVPSRPTVSPYINLANGGDAGINYYGLVRPQVAFNQAIRNLNANVSNLEAEQNDSALQTGKRSSFMTQRRYFMTNGSSGGASASRGVPAPPARAPTSMTK